MERVKVLNNQCVSGNYTVGKITAKSASAVSLILILNYRYQTNV